MTGAGVDRLDQATMMRLGIPVANVLGGSNGAVAEYAVTAASVLLRRMAWADHEIKSGRYAPFRSRMMNDNLNGDNGNDRAFGGRANDWVKANLKAGDDISIANFSLPGRPQVGTGPFRLESDDDQIIVRRRFRQQRLVWRHGLCHAENRSAWRDLPRRPRADGA